VIASGLSPGEVTDAVAMLATHLTRVARGARRSRGVQVDAIDGAPALMSPHVPALNAAGFRRETSGLRHDGERFGGARA
jgi:hypothetical protein